MSPMRYDGRKLLVLVLGGVVWEAAAPEDPTGLPRVMGSICG